MPVLTVLQRICRDAPEIGLLSPQIDGGVANPAPRFRARPGDFYISQERLAFVCVYIPARTRQLIGDMNEAFTGYGGEDDDFCRRVKEAGLQLAVTPLVSVKHGFGRRSWSASFARLMTRKQQDNAMAEMLHSRSGWQRREIAASPMLGAAQLRVRPMRPHRTEKAQGDREEWPDTSGIPRSEPDFDRRPRGSAPRGPTSPAA